VAAAERHVSAAGVVGHAGLDYRRDASRSTLPGAMPDTDAFRHRTGIVWPAPRARPAERKGFSPMQETVLTRAFFEYRHDLIAFLKHKLKCAATADDLCQDIYLKLRRVDDPGAIENCRGYLFMMAANLVSDRVRIEARRLSLLNEGHEAVRPAGQERTPEDVVVARAEIAYLNRAVARLPEMSRTIFYANRFENRTQRQIAAQFEISISTVEYHIRKVLDHLAEARKEFHRQL
jgi:RNA polymerase sigma-70 factor (ECF subfamily)